jgi:hypothetical protein
MQLWHSVDYSISLSVYASREGAGTAQAKNANPNQDAIAEGYHALAILTLVCLLVLGCYSC